MHIVRVALEGSDDSYSESKSSKFTDGLNVACSHEGLLCTLFLGQQEQLQSLKQLMLTTTFTAVM